MTDSSAAGPLIVLVSVLIGLAMIAIAERRAPDTMARALSQMAWVLTVPAAAYILAIPHGAFRLAEGGLPLLATLVSGAAGLVAYRSLRGGSLRGEPPRDASPGGPGRVAALCLGGSTAAVALLATALEVPADRVSIGFWMALFAAWTLAWAGNDRLAALEPRSRAGRALLSVAVPIVFGAWLLVLWEFTVRWLDVPRVLLPAPSAIAERFAASTPILWADFVQTFVRSVLVGWAAGCALGFAVGIAIDRSPFLKRGLLPIGNLASALPIVGLAPIMVMWFGFDWQSKVAVVVVMTFFPMLVNTVAGLAASTAMQRDLMRGYGASYAQTLVKLRLPEALPFIFNALKINSTLALIGAIVAEFFGTPIVGMGFRISTEVGRMNVDMVWAEIAVAALAGTAFYGVLAGIERVVTHWHPSVRGRSAH